MTTLATSEKWTFAGVDLSSYATLVASVAGADEMPPLRGDDAAKTGLTGRQYLAKLLDYRRVTLVLFVSSLSASGVDGGAAQARTNLDALYAVLAPRAQAALVRTMPDASTRQAQAECVAVNNFQDPVAHHAFILSAEFRLTDPWWYGASTTGPGSTSINANPKDITFVNPGSARNHRLLIDITGSITNPRVTNQTTGAFVQFTGTVGASKHLLIDPYAFTITNDGADVIGSLSHGPTVPWLDIVPGSQVFRVTGGTTGSIVITAWPAYL